MHLTMLRIITIATAREVPKSERTLVIKWREDGAGISHDVSPMRIFYSVGPDKHAFFVAELPYLATRYGFDKAYCIGEPAGGFQPLLEPMFKPERILGRSQRRTLR